MPTIWWDDPRLYNPNAGGGIGIGSGSVPEEIPRRDWSAWDKATIGGMDVPGHVVIFTKKEKKHDVLSPAGVDGGDINHLGVDPVEMDITITLWTPGQFTAYERLLGLVLPKSFPTGKSQIPRGLASPQFLADEQDILGDPFASSTATVEGPPTMATSFDLQHPPLNMLGVRAIYIYEVGSLIPGPVFGAKVAVWRAMERRPPEQTKIQLASGNGLYAKEIIDRRPVPTQPTPSPARSGIAP